MPKKHNLSSKISVTSTLFTLFSIIIYSCSSAFDIPTFHLDGAFQTASGLFRINSGQVPGRDFFPYLGIGPLLIIYPFFKIAGATLFSSVFSAQFVTLILRWISLAILWRFIFKPKTTFASLTYSSAIFVFPFLIAHKFSGPFEPGNSLRPIRAAAPYLTAIAIYFLMTKCKANKSMRDCLAGLIFGITLLWSNDFAIPTAGSFFIFYSIYSYSEDKNRWSKSFSISLISTFAFYVIILSIITIGHPTNLFKYNFFDVATDQWWYFGPYTTESRIFKIEDLSKLFVGKSSFPLFFLLLSTIIACRKKNLEFTLFICIGVTLFLGGCLASIGGHLDSYFNEFHYWATAGATFSIIKTAASYNKDYINSNTIIAKFFLLSMIMASSLYIFFSKSNQYINLSNQNKNNPDKFFVEELGGYLNTDWKDYVEFIRKSKDHSVIEDYWGIWSSMNRKFPPWPIDSVIHALGHTREISKKYLTDTDYIVSTRYSTSPIWQPWNISYNFWFYDELISNREPIFVSPASTVWIKTKKIRTYENAECRISSQKSSFEINPAIPGYYKVELNYQLSGNGRFLFMLKNNIADSSGEDGYVSLPIKNSKITIPLLITPYSGNNFESKFLGSTNIKLEIQSCEAQIIKYKNSTILYMDPSQN